ncbi:putative nucleoporin-like protein [Glarea lozoyensis 74030]|uniref:Putative nucleoporin-like protein n=1 Tax=Glarea lozoyensis (strain ATCC 74030 / MF5533) TaxID=1104152 RepID=H0EGE2_GLAL7|nr:putative nucleoporin-like protein [Glarea lozoyensis 74030]
MTRGRTPDETSHTITWKFTPLDSLTKSGDHGDDYIEESYLAKTAHNIPTIRQPGLYTLTSVKSQFCEGEVKEPASCLLLNPPEPQLSISSENINDKCAGKPIGLLVDLDLIGTPPFVVRYDVITGSGTKSEIVNVKGVRQQLELKPRDAGHFKYRFTSIDDDVYKAHTLGGSEYVLEQDVKPPASASLRKSPENIDACIEEPVELHVDLFGERPFSLEYELVHNGKRERFKKANIETDFFTIKTNPLLAGGEYSLALTSVQDKTGCKIFLNSDVKFNVRRQRPKASFGLLDGKFKTIEVEGQSVQLPLRLTGRPPYTVSYRNLDDSPDRILTKTAKLANDYILADRRGKYEIVDVSDDKCPGTVNQQASTFEIDWIARPQIKVADTSVLTSAGDRWVKREVCEGDIDGIEIHLTGKFSEISDALYDHDSKKHTPLILEQKVNRKPSAHFIKPGQSYKYCKEDLAGDEVIPIRLEGVPPFSLEVEIKHQSSARPETVKFANIETHQYDFKIPHSKLSLGIHQVSVRKVRDSRGCQQKTEYGAPHVQVQVYDVPTIHPQESRTDYCVGERISYSLSGQPPFEIFYTFNGVSRKAKSQSTTFRRIAEKPGNFTITGVSDKASECKARTNISKLIHQMPSVRISKGREMEIDIHEGGHADLVFEFTGTPPFEFTYTRSTNVRKGQRSQVLETRRDVSDEFSKTVVSSLEGTYEVVAIKDRYCSFSTQGGEGGGKGHKLLQF